MESKRIEKKVTGRSLSTGSNTRWNYFGRTLNRLVFYFNQYNACFEEICSINKIRKTVKKANHFKILLDRNKFFHLIRFFTN